jgi:hypothetical protein
MVNCGIKELDANLVVLRPASHSMLGNTRILHMYMCILKLKVVLSTTHGNTRRNRKTFSDCHSCSPSHVPMLSARLRPLRLVLSQRCTPFLTYRMLTMYLNIHVSVKPL